MDSANSCKKRSSVNSSLDARSEKTDASAKFSSGNKKTNSFVPYKSHVGDTAEQRKSHIEKNLGIELGEAIGGSSWRRGDDPDKVITVFYNACQGNYLDTGTNFFCMCVGGSEEPYRKLVRQVEDAGPLRTSRHMLRYTSTNIHKCRHLFPRLATDSKPADVEEILYCEQEFPGEPLLQLPGILKTKQDVFRIFKQFLEFAAFLDTQHKSVFDRYHHVISSTTVKLEDGESVLKFKPTIEFLPYEQLVQERFVQPPHPELWDEEHGGYFCPGEKSVDHPEKLQVYSLGMIFGRILLGRWLLHLSMGKMPLFDDKFDFQHCQGAVPLSDQNNPTEAPQPLASDEAFLDFVRLQMQQGTSKYRLAQETVDAVLADEGFMRDWRSMLQYKSMERPTAAEILDAATWTPDLVAVTLYAPLPPLNGDSAVDCIGMNGVKIGSYRLVTHDRLASVRAAVAKQLELQQEDLRLLLPCGQLLIGSDDERLLVDCLQIESMTGGREDGV